MIVDTLAACGAVVHHQVSFLEWQFVRTSALVCRMLLQAGLAGCGGGGPHVQLRAQRRPGAAAQPDARGHRCRRGAPPARQELS